MVNGLPVSLNRLDAKYARKDVNIDMHFVKKWRMLAFGLVLMVLLVTIFLSLCSIKSYLEPELVKIVRLDPAYYPSGNIYESWHAVYEAYDGYPGTWVHPHEYHQTQAIDEWPEMDLKNYTYIITYCQEIKSLSHYMWRENNVPTSTGAKEAHLVLEEKVQPLTVYIYRIPKMRINNPEI